MPSIYINGVNICAPSSNCEIEDPNAIEEDLNALAANGVASPEVLTPLPTDNGDAESIDATVAEIALEPSKISATIIHSNNVDIPEITI